MKRIVITGLGVISSLGLNVESFWNHLIRSESGIRKTPWPWAPLGGCIHGFDPPPSLITSKEATRLGEFIQYSLAACDQALKHSGLEVGGALANRVGSFVGMTASDASAIQQACFDIFSGKRLSAHAVNHSSNMVTAYITQKFGCLGPSYVVAAACASSAQAIGKAFDEIQLGYIDVGVVCGVQGPLSQLQAEIFKSLKALAHHEVPSEASRPFDRDRSGFVMAEGAAALVVESLESALGRGATILAEICSYAATSDAHHITAPSGLGAEMCMKLALERANLRPQELSFVHAHATGTLVGDRIEADAIYNVFGKSNSEIFVTSSKGQIGHPLGASGAMESVVCILALQHQVLPPQINLLHPVHPEINFVRSESMKIPLQSVLKNSFGFGGANVCIVFKKYDTV